MNHQAAPRPIWLASPSTALIGRAGLTVSAQSGTTRLVDLSHSAPLRILFPRVPPDEPFTACLANIAGGMVGGDVHRIELRAEAKARLLAIGQAAEKIYRSAQDTCELSIDIHAGGETWVEWLPQESILFDGARFARQTRLHLQNSARALAGDILVFGRLGHGERFRQGMVRDRFDVKLEGRLIWADALDLGADPTLALDHPAGFNGANASALLVLYAPEPEASRDCLRMLPIPEGVQFGVSALSGLVIGRWLGWDVRAMRQHFAAAWVVLREKAGGCAPRLSSLWHV